MMSGDMKKFLLALLISLFFVLLATWNDVHFDEDIWITDPFLLPIPIIWVAFFVSWAWWFKMKDGNPRLATINDNFTINRSEALLEIKAQGPWPKYWVYAINGIDRPDFVVNLRGGGKKYGYFIAPWYCFTIFFVQVFCWCQRIRIYDTPLKKTELPPHLIPELVEELKEKKKMFYDENTIIRFGSQPLFTLKKVKYPEDHEHQDKQIESLNKKLEKEKEINKEWQESLGDVLRAMKSMGVNYMKNTKTPDFDEEEDDKDDRRFRRKRY